MQDMLSTSNNSELEASKAACDVHRTRVSIARLRYMQRAALSKAFPHLFLHMCIDGMDNKKTNLPHCHAALFSKDVDNVGMELQTKLLGGLVDGVAFFTFLTFPTYMHGTGLTWTGFMIMLDRLKAAGRPIPPYLFLQLDNAGKDNKNQHAFAFLGYLVKLGVFKRIFLHFLPVGHTHAEIDQRFSVISQKIRSKDVLTPSALRRHMSGLFKEGTPLRRDIELEAVADIGTFFEGTYQAFGGQGTFRDSGNRKRRVHAILIKDSKDPVIVFKEHDEFGAWEGEWNTHKPLAIFKDSRTLENDLAGRTLMQTDLVRIELDEIEKKWKVLEPLVEDAEEKKRKEEKMKEAEKEKMTRKGKQKGKESTDMMRNAKRRRGGAEGKENEEPTAQPSTSQQATHTQSPSNPAEPPAPTYASIRLQQEDYKEASRFWPDFLQREKAVWHAQGKDVVRMKSNKPSIQAQLPTPSPNNLSKGEKRLAVQILKVSGRVTCNCVLNSLSHYPVSQALDDPSQDFPPLPHTTDKLRISAYDSLLKLRAEEEEMMSLLENPLVPKPAEAVFLYHSSNPPLSKTLYNPWDDALPEQVAIINCEAEAGEDPFDLVKIKEVDKKKGTFDGINMEPYCREGYLRRGITVWPEGWIKERLVPAMFKQPGKGRRDELFMKVRKGLPLDCIQFSAHLNKTDGCIRAAMQKNVIEAVEACKAGSLSKAVNGLDDDYDDDDDG